MKIKICGITRLEDARYSAGAGADFLGFIQHRESPRYIEPESAKEIISWVHGPAPVGVFVNEAADEINDVSGQAGFAFAQLHGDESPALCAEVSIPVIKTLSVFPDTTVDDLRSRMEAYRPYVSLFLLDTGSASLRGGTGERFDWSIARALAREAEFFLAGGLSAENVATAIHTIAPFGLDAASSLEYAPGQKDLSKIDAYFAAVRSAIATSEAGHSWN